MNTASRGSERRGSCGFTLVEVTLSACLTAALLGTAAMLTRTAMGMFRLRSSEEEASMRVHRALRSIALEFAGAARSELLPDPVLPDGASVLGYRRVVGYAGGVQRMGDALQVGFEYESGELDDGLDNNGNGLVDEGVVVWIESPGTQGEQRVVKCRGVREFAPGEIQNGADDDGNGVRDDRGLSFWISGDLLSVALTVEEVGPGGIVLEKSARTSVHIRN